MGRLFLVQLDGRTYSCKHCRSHLALSEELISKSFHCKNGRAYLFNTVDLRVHTLDFGRDWKRWSFGALVFGLKQRSGNTSRSLKHALLDMNVNVFVGPLEDRMMTTGMHTVADIFCNCCGRIVGWKYEAAYEKSQKYKEGKFILERGRMVDGGDGRNFLVDTPVVGSDADDI